MINTRIRNERQGITTNHRDKMDYKKNIMND